MSTETATALTEPARRDLLLALATGGGRATFSELGRTVGLTDGNLHRHLDVLGQAGLIRREHNGAAGRASKTHLVLTGTGRVAMATLAVTLREQAEAIASALAVPETVEQGEAEGLENHLL